MSRRATVVNMVEGNCVIVAGEPILDTSDGVLIVAFDDGTSRVFNWDHVMDYYYMTPDEYEYLRQQDDR